MKKKRRKKRENGNSRMFDGSNDTLPLSSTSWERGIA